ncbi:MAG: (2Fe-2S)-binding protein [Deltaproteobacteria bacterium]|nr:(2Fe-2S)-binding protein [Deltaproteobacteria bacterium]
MPTVTVNGVSVDVPEGINVVKAAELAGQEIPHYCYHPALSVAGNCRMCLIDIRAMSAKQPNPLPKLQIGCNTIVADGMVVETDNPRVEEARRGVLEFLLINHPIDCPICDQAGECKLQEYYMDYGRYHSRFALAEKQHKHKVTPVGPDIMLDQERCILCTRCVRFLEEVTGTNELCVKERGDHSELSLARGKSVDNPYATNIVDLCPVGALTSREFRFQARVWYLDSVASVCMGCSTGCNIDVHFRRDNLYRVKPRANAEVNGYWMCDAGRRTWRDNHGDHRLVASYTRRGDEFVQVDASDAVSRSATLLQGCRKVAIVASASVSMEEGYLLACIARILGAGPCIVPSPAVSEIADDGRLISTDRYPNRAGLLALGYREADALPPDVDGVVVVRCDVVGGDEAAWGAALEAMKATVVVDDRIGKAMAYADQVLAIASHFEAFGTVVNRKGRLQAFRGAVPAPGAALAGWQSLAGLLEALGGERYDTADDVFAALCAALNLGSARTHAQLASGGATLGQWAAARASTGFSDAPAASPA